MSLLKQHYRETVRKKLNEQFAYVNPMQIPKLQKIIVHMGVAEAAKDKNVLQSSFGELMMLSGQKPILTLAKKSISNFKLRKGMPIGIKVTLRADRMYDFLYRLIHIVFPRIPDFRGFPLRFDGKGNYTFGLKDQQCFPEVDLDRVQRIQGMHISLATSAQTDSEALFFLQEMGFPFARK